MGDAVRGRAGRNLIDRRRDFSGDAPRAGGGVGGKPDAVVTQVVQAAGLQNVLVGVDRARDRRVGNQEKRRRTVVGDSRRLQRFLVDARRMTRLGEQHGGGGLWRPRHRGQHVRPRVLERDLAEFSRQRRRGEGPRSGEVRRREPPARDQVYTVPARPSRNTSLSVLLTHCSFAVPGTGRYTGSPANSISSAGWRLTNTARVRAGAAVDGGTEACAGSQRGMSGRSLKLAGNVRGRVHGPSTLDEVSHERPSRRKYVALAGSRIKSQFVLTAYCSGPFPRRCQIGDPSMFTSAAGRVLMKIGGGSALSPRMFLGAADRSSTAASTSSSVIVRPSAGRCFSINETISAHLGWLERRKIRVDDGKPREVDAAIAEGHGGVRLHGNGPERGRRAVRPIRDRRIERDGRLVGPLGDLRLMDGDRRAVASDKRAGPIRADRPSCFAARRGDDRHPSRENEAAHDTGGGPPSDSADKGTHDLRVLWAGRRAPHNGEACRSSGMCVCNSRTRDESTGHSRQRGGVTMVRQPLTAHRAANVSGWDSARTSVRWRLESACAVGPGRSAAACRRVRETAHVDFADRAARR